MIFSKNPTLCFIDSCTFCFYLIYSTLNLNMYYHLFFLHVNSYCFSRVIKLLYGIYPLLYKHVVLLTCLLEMPSMSCLIGLDILCFHFHSILRFLVSFLNSVLTQFSFSSELFSVHEFVHFFCSFWFFFICNFNPW